MSVLFAATYPERTTALALYGVFAKRIWSPDYPWAPKPDDRAREIDELERNWAERMDLDKLAPSEDDAFKERMATYFRRSASPGAAAALMRMNTEIDVRDVLPTIQAPTLVLPSDGRSRRECRGGPLDREPDPGRQVRRAAGRCAHALGRRHGQHRRRDRGVPDGARRGPEPESRARDRPLHRHRRLDGTSAGSSATAVGGAPRAAPRRSCGTQLTRYQGREVDTAGDGFFATFDGPARAIRCASGRRRRRSRARPRDPRGVHTGECELARGQDRRDRRDTGRPSCGHGRSQARCSSRRPSRISSPARASRFEDRGEHELKGVGAWRLYSVVDA